MNKALLALGIALVAVPAYDETVSLINEHSANVTLRHLWGDILWSPATGPPAMFSETWLAILGAILILIAAFVSLG
jgi:hypothetical protein